MDSSDQFDKELNELLKNAGGTSSDLQAEADAENVLGPDQMKELAEKVKAGGGRPRDFLKAVIDASEGHHLVLIRMECHKDHHGKPQAFVAGSTMTDLLRMVTATAAETSELMEKQTFERGAFVKKMLSGEVPLMDLLGSDDPMPEDKEEGAS